MALLSTLAVTSYFGAVRGMSIRSAKRHFENALVQARQRACIDGARVSLIAFNEIASYESDGITVKDMAACFVVRVKRSVGFRLCPERICSTNTPT